MSEVSDLRQISDHKDGRKSQISDTLHISEKTCVQSPLLTASPQCGKYAMCLQDAHAMCCRV